MQTTCFGHVDIVLNVSSSYFFNVLLTVSPAGQICELRAAYLCFSEVFAVELPQIIPAVHCVEWSPFKGTDGAKEGHWLLSSHQLHIGPEELTWKGKEQQAHLTWHSLQSRTQQQRRSTASREPQCKNSPKVRKQPHNCCAEMRERAGLLHTPEKNTYNFMPPRNQHSCCTENKPSAKTHFPRTQLAKGRVIKENEFSFVWCQGFGVFLPIY